MAADWQAIENGIQAWGVRASALDTAKVIWDGQDGARPQPPFVELRIDTEHPTSAIPEVVVSDNPDATPGAEILIDTISHEELSLAVHVYTTPTVGPNAAKAMASRMKAQIASEAEIANFDVLGLALVEIGPVQNLTAVLETRSEGRATFTVRLRVADGFTQTETYVETVDPPTGTITE